VHEVRESGVKMRNHLPCLNRKLNRCPFCGCGDLNVFVFDGMGMALDYMACVECPSCRGRGPEVPENRSTTARSGKAKGPKHFSQPRKDVRDCKHCGRKTKSASGFCVHCLSERVESHKAETCQPEFVFVISDTNPKWGRFVTKGDIPVGFHIADSLDPTVLRQDEPTEHEVFDLKNQACDAWNKALGKFCDHCVFCDKGHPQMVCAKTGVQTAQFHVCDKFHPFHPAI